jgi:hypothetical protein
MEEIKKKKKKVAARDSKDTIFSHYIISFFVTHIAISVLDLTWTFFNINIIYNSKHDKHNSKHDNYNNKQDKYNSKLNTNIKTLISTIFTKKIK